MEPDKIYMGLLSPVLCDSKAAVLIIELRCSWKDFRTINAPLCFSWYLWHEQSATQG